jgi:riboflavin kinase/FMN adenylyltransferase
MKVTRGLPAHRRSSYPVVTIGNFDGQHRGHRWLLRTVVETARANRGTALVVTFDPHPVRILAPQVELQFLTSKEEKLAQFGQAGIDEVILLDFTRELAALSPEEFVEQVLCEAIGVKEIFVGEHFAFGRGRAGRIADLERLGLSLGFRVHPLAPYSVDGEVVSSSTIRRMLQEGHVQRAATFLGRPYSLGGRVTHGEQRGRSMGWPTANLPLPPGRVIPADGVYATTMHCDGRALASVSYIGTRPTFGSGDRLLEVYLLDERLDLYGADVLVQFVARLRGDHTFDSPDALAAQIGLDVKQARELLAHQDHVAVDG